MVNSSSFPVDVAIVGGGIAGAAAAHVLARKGLRTVLLDAYAVYPPCFKAEKIEPDQADLLRKLGLFDPLLPWTGKIHSVLDAKAGRVLQRLEIEQYGIKYHDMVNEVRRQLPAAVEFRIERVQTILPSSNLQKVVLDSGSEILARIVVLASGAGGRLHESLGIQKRWIQKEQSFAFGFDVRRNDGKPFPFESLTYYPDGTSTRISYLTLFPIQNTMRANLFVFRSPTEDWVRNFLSRPGDELEKALPKLSRLTGKFEVAGNVERGRVDLYATAGFQRPGLILIGDAFQNVCPTTGLGLTKVLTDVDVLTQRLIAWFSTPGADAEKLFEFYSDPRKVSVDDAALRGARYHRQLALDTSLRWSIHRSRVYWEMGFRGWAKPLDAPPGRAMSNAGAASGRQGKTV